MRVVKVRKKNDWHYLLQVMDDNQQNIILKGLWRDKKIVLWVNREVDSNTYIDLFNKKVQDLDCILNYKIVNFNIMSKK